ncbi:MAG: glycosyltransferase family 9 protein [Parasutterella sp.]
MATLFVRLPNHVGDAVMTMPALNLLEAAGFKLYLIGKPFVGELFEGTNRRFDPIEGNLLDDIKRIRDLAASVKNPRGILMPNSFGSALLFKSAGIQSTGLATDGRSILLEHAIPEPPRMHEVERFWYVAYEALKAMGIKPPYTKLTKRINMKLAARNEAGARNLAAKIGLPKRYAILAPIAKGRHEGKEKYWRHFNELCKRFATEASNQWSSRLSTKRKLLRPLVRTRLFMNRRVSETLQLCAKKPPSLSRTTRA